uniref:Protein ZIP4 homolog n=1 Tax=Hippocampus comes TaxID=109280 RepID=A0A3Q2YN06_HIPCM
NSNEVVDTLFSEVSALEDDVKIVDPQLEQCAIQLWNWAVSKNVGDSVSTSQKAKRHAACCLMYCSEPVNPPEGTIRKQILMAGRTGRTWLDCKNPEMADHFLRLAIKQSVETLFGLLTARGHGTPDNDSLKMDVEKDLLRILSYQAESAVIQGRHQEAVAHVQRCKDMLHRLPLLQTSFLSLMCYNFGIDTYHHQKFEECTFWLAKVLRLLATAYLEWDALRFHGEALIAVDMANKKCVSTSGLFLKITILLRGGASDESIAALDEMLRADVSLEICLSAVKLLLSENEAPAFELLKRASQQFESSPALGTALVLHIELLLHRDKELLGKQKIEDVINHYTGKQLAPQDLTSLHAMLWDKAAKYATDYSEALQWYNYSLSFFQAGDMDSNLAKLQRNRTFCFMQLKQLEKAKEAVHEAERCDPDSIFTQFSLFKIAMHENDAERAKAVNTMALLSKNLEAAGPVSENATSSLLCRAAQIALENKQQDTATKVLENLCETCKDEALVLKALCLVRLVLTTVEASDDEKDGSLDALLPYLKMLQKLSQRLCLTAEQCTEEANWFRKIWNAALQCESNPDRMRDFFVLSYQLSQMCRPDRAILMAQKTCLLMAAAAALEWCRAAPHADPTDTLLLLYEFEARAKLNDPEVASVLDSILEQDNVEAKVLQTIALAMEPPAHFPLLCKKALRVALSVHKKQAQVDPTQCQCIHSLIKLSLPSGASQMEARLLHEAWDYYEEALAVIAASILWLLTRAWNTGILLYSLARYLEAEKWCGLGMSFVRHLGPLQDSYKTQ